MSPGVPAAASACTATSGVSPEASRVADSNRVRLRTRLLQKGASETKGDTPARLKRAPCMSWARPAHRRPPERRKGCTESAGGSCHPVQITLLSDEKPCPRQGRPAGAEQARAWVPDRAVL